MDVEVVRSGFHLQQMTLVSQIEMCSFRFVEVASKLLRVKILMSRCKKVLSLHPVGLINDRISIIHETLMAAFIVTVPSSNETHFVQKCHNIFQHLH